MLAGNHHHKNQLLSALSEADRSLLAPLLRVEPTERHQTFEAPHEPIQDVYFIEQGFASVVWLDGDGFEVEVGVIGNEGVTGLAVLLGNHRSPNRCFVQVGGSALRIAADDLRREMAVSPSLNSLLLRYVHCFLLQSSGTVSVNSRGTLKQSLARWLLMAHDRLGGEELPLTHEFLSSMIGVRRAGVTETVQSLNALHLISSERGLIRVLDREGLEKLAGAFYGMPEAEWHRLMAAG